MALLAAQGLYRMAAWPYHSASPSEPRAGTGSPASLAHSARICGLACKSAICSSSCRCWDGPMSRRLGASVGCGVGWPGVTALESEGAACVSVDCGLAPAPGTGNGV